MANSRSQFTDYDDKLPIDYPLQKALSIYLKRLKIFFAVVLINILVFLSFIAIQRLSIQLIYLLNINILVALLFVCVSLFSFTFIAYQRRNPVKGYLVFSDETKKNYPIGLYTGWRITKKKFGRYLPLHWNIGGLVARNISRQGHMKFGEPSRIHIQILDKSLKTNIYYGEIMEGETKTLHKGIIVSYHQKNRLTKRELERWDSPPF